MFLLSGLLLERRGHAFSLVFLVILTCSLRLVKLVTLVSLSKGFFFIGFRYIFCILGFGIWVLGCRVIDWDGGSRSSQLP